MNLWTADELKAATQGEMIGQWAVDGLSIDSRDIQKGDLFIALSAARDGHEFVASALQKGAAGALVSYVPEGVDAGRLLIVDDVELALAKMGRYRRAQLDAKIVAVTGSAGKTSTKEMLKTALSVFGATHASVKSFNNHWGVPLTLARTPRNAKFGVYEIGMNHPGEIEPLVQQVQPDIAVITNIAPVHLAGFDGEEGIALEKASILKGLNREGLGIVNGDMEFRDFVAGQANGRELRFFGEGEDNHARLTHLELSTESTKAQISVRDDVYDLSIGASGRHHAFNALIVASVLDAFELDIQKGLDALSHWDAPSGRGEKFTISSPKGDILLVDESYNANPLSMKTALDAFLLIEAKRHIAVLGDMRELGLQSARFHRELARDERVAKLDKVYAVGEEMANFSEACENPNIEYTNDKGDLFNEIIAFLDEGDAVLVKGSLAIGLGRVVDQFKEFGQSSQKK